MSRYDDLERLAKLHNDGVLSDEEFQKEKTRLLVQPGNTGAEPVTENSNGAEKITIAVSPRSRLLALLLCFFVGDFGIHRLYTGHKKSAAIMAILSLLTLFSCARLLSSNIDFNALSSGESGWEYFGELNMENGRLMSYAKNSNSFFSVFFIGMIVSIWKFIDLILILSGQFKDGQKRTLLRW